MSDLTLLLCAALIISLQVKIPMLMYSLKFLLWWSLSVVVVVVVVCGWERVTVHFLYLCTVHEKWQFNWRVSAVDLATLSSDGV